jgi:hypothetical protein
LIDGIFGQISLERVSFYEPAKKICAAQSCEIILNGKAVYSDTYHITPQGSLEFRDDITKAIGRLIPIR